MSETEENIKKSIYKILSTAKGEITLHPDFGCGIHDLIFHPIDAVTLNLAENAVREALTTNEPRIEIVNTKASTEANPGTILISVIYRVRSTDNYFYLFYPFHLGGGN